jgi:Mg-chelatase subunit ChlD
MSNDLANPLQGFLAKAAKNLPATTGAVAVHQQRIDRRAGEVVILADVSGSMEDAAWGGERKIDLLRKAVAAARAKSKCRLIVFSNDAYEAQEIPEPEANTNLVSGLLAAKRHDPGTTLVISDGRPDNPEKTLQLARQFRGVIDVLYIGPEGDIDAINFMRRLAAAANGEVTINDISGKIGAQKLLSCITALLPSATV